MPDLPSISFLRGSDIAQYVLLCSHNGSPSAASGDVILPGLGTTVGMSKAAQSPCGLIAATLLSPWPLDGRDYTSRRKHLRGRIANCFITRAWVFHLTDVNDTTAHEPQLVGPKALCRLASLPPQSFPVRGHPRSAGSSSHATRFTVNERALAV